MKKFKSFLPVLAMMLVLWGGVLFISCSNDDDANEPTPIETPDDDKTTGGNTTDENTTGGETAVEVAPLYIVGLAPDDVRLPFKVISGTEQEFTFIYHHEYQMDTGLNCGSWSKVPGKISFRITKNGESYDWSVDWGGVQDNGDGSYDSVATVLSANANEYTALNMRGSTVAPSYPGNIFVYDLVEGATYTLSVNFNAATNYVGVKIGRCL
ncbi:MAG: hypothetical protein HDR51_06400 [Treponema sp.]|nr:hypothetical protein [Treponema sp.]